MAAQFDYDIAFSFAGEDRHLVEPLTNRLKQQGVTVFYDRDKQAQLWGENLQEGLTEVYLKQARFCVMFISRAYAEKMWTRHERWAAMARAMQQKGAYILPIRLDRTELEGLLPTVGYINLAEHSEEEVAGLILEKLDADVSKPQSLTSVPSFNIPMPKVKKTFSQREKDVFARQSFETIQTYFQTALARLGKHDPDVDVEFDPVHRSKFLAKVYVKGAPANTCKIWLGSPGYSSSDEHICYFQGRNVSRDQDNPTNDMLSVTDDKHQLGLEGLRSGMRFASMMSSMNEERILTAERAAEILWELFIKPLSVD